MFAIIVLCLALEEEFPFSHFPMYDSFSNYTFYVYVTDAKDQPIPVEGISSIRTGRLKKVFNTYTDEIAGKSMSKTSAEERRAPGEATLEFLVESCKEHGRPELDKHRPLRFHMVELMIEEGEFVRKHTMVAQEKGGAE